MTTPLGVKQRQSAGDLSAYGIKGEWLIGKATRPRKAKMRALRKRIGAIQKQASELDGVDPLELTPEQEELEDKLDRESDQLLCELIETALEDVDGNAATGVAAALEASLEAGTIETDDVAWLVDHVNGNAEPDQEDEGEASARTSDSQ